MLEVFNEDKECAAFSTQLAGATEQPSPVQRSERWLVGSGRQPPDGVWTRQLSACRPRERTVARPDTACHLPCAVLTHGRSPAN